MFGTRLTQMLDDAAELARRGVADRVGDVDRGGAGVDGRFDDLGRGSRARCGRRLRARTRRRRSSPCARFTPSTARRTISSLAILSLNSRWMALVARKTWMRASGASWSASQARSMSSSLQRARPQIVEPRTVRAISRTASKSPGEAMGKPASITSTPKSTQRLGDLQLLGEVHAAAGRLLAVAERGVENDDASGIRCGHGSLATQEAIEVKMSSRKTKKPWGRAGLRVRIF